MTRWHSDSCRRPNVIASDNVPFCRTCNRAPNLPAIISAHDNGRKSSSALPSDEDPGALNLWWPRSVTYVTNPRNQHGNQSYSENNRRTQNATTQSITQPSRRERINPPYQESLGQDKFRLIHFDSGDHGFHHHDVVHISLETHQRTTTPRYDTVSYAWSGENDDNTQHHPVYIGEYWDILLQTRNCHDMLLFLKAQQGVRHVWVDAICINQNDSKEKSIQVDLMSKTYAECDQVIVYLGKDAIAMTKRPVRSRLESLIGGLTSSDAYARGADRRMDLSWLLSRRYMTRVWVIQELILSPRAILRIGKIDFVADGRTFELEETTETATQGSEIGNRAFWFTKIGRGENAVPNIIEAARLTRCSESSDPRDKIFGILGFVQGRQDNPLEPDYTLSQQHVFMGFFAHCLLNLYYSRILDFARGIRAPAAHPSWLPDWKSRDCWENVFPPADRRRLDPRRLGKQASRRLGWIDTAENHHRYEWFPWLRYIKSIRASFEEIPENHSFEQTVDSADGSLVIEALHLFDVGSQPIHMGHIDTLQLFEVDGPKCKLCLASRVDLAHLVVPLEDHIFMFYRSVMCSSEFAGTKLVPVSYLILRPTTGRRRFRLVAACEQVFIFNSDKIRYPKASSIVVDTEGIGDKKRSSRWYKPLNLLWQYDGWCRPEYPGPWSHPDSRRNVTIGTLQRVTTGRVQRKHTWRQAFVFLGEIPARFHNRWQLFPLLSSVLQDEGHPYPRFSEAYLRLLPPLTKARIEDGHVILTANIRETGDEWWTRMFETYSADISDLIWGHSRPTFDNYCTAEGLRGVTWPKWSWRIGTGHWREFPNARPPNRVKSFGVGTELRCSIGEIRSWFLLEEESTITGLRRILGTTHTTLDDIRDSIQRPLDTGESMDQCGVRDRLSCIGMAEEATGRDIAFQNGQYLLPRNEDMDFNNYRIRIV